MPLVYDLPPMPAFEQPPPPCRLVVIADVVNSRAYPETERRRAQRAISSAVEFAEMSVTVGDEFELSMAPNLDCWRAFWRYRIALFAGLIDEIGVELRCAIASGEVWVASSTGPNAQDGPVFHQARRAMEQLREHDVDRRRRSAGSPWLPVASYTRRTSFGGTPGGPTERHINATLTLIDMIMEGWTPAQKKAVALWLTGEEYASIAQKEGVSSSAIAERLHTARFDQFLVAVDAVGSAMGLERGIDE